MAEQFVTRENWVVKQDGQYNAMPEKTCELNQNSQIRRTTRSTEVLEWPRH